MPTATNALHKKIYRGNFTNFFLASEKKVPLIIKGSFHYKNSTLKRLSANPWQEKCKERNSTKSFAKAILSSHQRMHLYDKDFMIERKFFFFFFCINLKQLLLLRPTKGSNTVQEQTERDKLLGFLHMGCHISSVERGKNEHFDFL